MHLLAITIPSWSSFFQYIFSGLTVGCIYALVALGFVTIAKVTGVYNFAQGQYVMVGGMVVAACARAQWSMWAAVPLAALTVAGVAVVQERLTVAPIRRAGSLPLVVASLGFGVALEGIALLIWGKDPLSAPSFNPGIFRLGGAYLSNQVIWVWSTTLVLLVFTVWLFRGTAVGRAMRACAINPIAARLLGIRVGSLSLVAFLLAGGISGIVAAVTVPTTGVKWDSGLTVGLVAFIAAALANFTSPVGAVAAGLSLGVIEALSAGIISSSYREAIVYGVLVAYLFGRDLFGDDGVIRRLVKQGQLGRSRRERVVRANPLHPPRPDGAPGQEAVAAPRATLPQRLRAVPVVSYVPLLAFGLAALSPIVLAGTPDALDTAIWIALYGMGATGLGLIMGLAGQFSLGQGAMYLVGGYIGAILSAKHHWNPLAGLVVAVLVGAVSALVISWLTVRLRGFNLAIATLAIQLILLVVVTEQVNLTGGTLGVTGVPVLKVFGLSLAEPVRFFYVALGVLGVCLLVARNITRSRIGRSLRAIGADQEGAESLGVHAARNKTMIFVVGAAMASAGGVLGAYYLQYAAPSIWGVKLTIDLVSFVVVGGIGSVYGPVTGALIVGWLQYWVRHSFATSIGGGSSQYEIIMSGLLIVVFILFFRDGVVEGLKPYRLHTAWGRIRSLFPTARQSATAESSLSSSDSSAPT